MELLFVWIEDYKNIHHQGFNFSPHLKFEFKPITELEKIYKVGLLIISDKNNNRLNSEAEIIGKLKDESLLYENFFEPSKHNNTENEIFKFEKQKQLGKISNLISIIGGNGAGKSNLLDFLYTRLNILIPVKNPQLKSSNSPLTSKYIIIFKNGDELFFDINGLRILQFDPTNADSRNFVKTYYYKHVYKSEITSEDIEFSINANKNSLIKFPFRIPDKININIDFPHFIKINDDLSISFDTEHEDRIYEPRDNNLDKLIINFLSPFYATYEDSNVLKMSEVERFKYNLIINIFINFYYRMFYDLPINNVIQENFKEKVVKEHFSNIAYSSNYVENINIILNFFEKITIWINQNKQNLSLPNIFPNRPGFGEHQRSIFSNNQNYLNFIKEIFIDINDLKFINKKQNKDIREAFTVTNKFFGKHQLILEKIILQSLQINYSYYWNRLSYGESVFLKLYSHFSNPNFKAINPIILIDEGDLGFHPEWQRKYLQYLINFFPQIYPGKQIQIILTSHSPFLASDLPKENIIFLRKGEDGDGTFSDGVSKKDKCIVVDGLNEKKQTFGANIHTLLSDSFFLKDGLIGEFAKNKIQKVIDYLNHASDRNPEQDKEMQKIIDMIGEPIIKRQLQGMMDSGRLQKVSEHEERIKQLEKEVEELKKNRNNP